MKKYLILIIPYISYVYCQQSPKDINGLKLWFVADSIFSSDGIFIDSLKDLAGNNNAFQYDNNFLPITKNTILNNHKSILFDGIDDYLIFDTINDIRTVFWVIKEDSFATNDFRPLLGHIEKYDFYRTSKAFWDITHTNQFVLDGETRLNSNIINGLIVDVPNQYSIVSVKTAGNVSANFLSKDRIPFNRVWHGEIVELIIYNNQLDNFEILNIENYLSNKYAPPINLNDTFTVCELPFNIRMGKDYYNSYKWNTGDTTDSLIIYSPGTYTVTVTNIFGRHSVDSITITIDTSDYTVDLASDTTICYGNKLLLMAGNSHLLYNWSTGDTSHIIEVNAPNIYKVTVTDCNLNVSIDSIFLQVQPLPYFEFNDTLFCFNNKPLSLSPSFNSPENYQYLWSTGSTDSVLQVSQSDTYILHVQDSVLCSFSDTVVVLVDSFPSKHFLPSDTSLCSGNTLGIYAGNYTIQQYSWSTGSTDSAIVLNTSGPYWVEAINSNGCINRDTVQVNIVGDAPTTQFVSNGYCAEQTITFTDNSIPPLGNMITQWAWDFGDGNTSNAQNPVHTYSNSGNYTVLLTATTDVGCSKTYSQQISVQETPSASFTSLTQGCTGIPVTFTSTSSTNTGFINYLKWDFNINPEDTLISSSANWTYSSPGSFQVSLVAVNNFGCSDTIHKNIEILNSPTAFFLAPETCAESSLQFSDNSIGAINQWNWNFGNGNTSTLPNPQNSYSSAGTYLVNLLVTDVYGCSHSYTQNIIVHPLPMVQYISPNLCLQTQTQFTDNSTSANGNIVSYEWDVTLNGIQNSYASKEIIITPTTLSPVLVQLKVTDILGCYNTLTDTVPVYSLPTADFNFTPLFGNPPLSVSFYNESVDYQTQQWSSKGLLLSSFENPILNFTDTGKTPIQLTILNAYGCADSLVKYIQVGNLLYDLEVYKIDFDWQKEKNMLFIHTYIKNKGNIPVYETRLYLQIYDESTLSEPLVFEHGLFPSDTFMYTFQSSVSLKNNTLPDNICVIAELPDVQEKNILNNTLCKGFNETFFISKVYPNPASNLCYIELFGIMKESVQFTLWNDRGQLVYSSSEPIDAGLNIIPLDVSYINDGWYILKMEHQGTVNTQKLEIIRGY